jgi:hypothetical protein
VRRKISWTLLAVVLVTLASFGPALAQDTNGPATIITFTSTVPFISVTDVEAGGTVTTLSWVAVGLDDDQRLILERYELNGFVSLLTPEETTLEPTGTRDVAIGSTSSFAPPTYRLSILDFRNRIIDQQTVTIPYVPPAEGETTTVEFTADAETLVPTALEAGNARVTVSWNIANRPPFTNPVFEQVLPNGEAVLVELPRDFLWVPSSGTGAVAPVAPETGSSIQLRLRVVDLLNGTVYGENTVTLSTSAATTPDASTPEVTVEGTADTTTEAPADNAPVQIVSFTATPDTVPLGGTVQLNWHVTGAASVQISVRTGSSIQQQLIAGNLPLRAGLSIPVTEDLFTGVPSLTFVIRPVDADGNSLGLGRADVTIGEAAPVETEATVEATVEAQG